MLPVVSFLPRQPRQAVDGQGFSGQAAILVECVLLGGLKKLLAAPRGSRIEPKNAADQSVRLGGQTVSDANLRDQARLHCQLGRYGFAEKHKRKGETRQRVFDKVCHDSGRRKAGTHFWKTEGCVLRDKSEITQDGESKAEAKSIALNLGNADQRCTSQ